jgi:hypothetical protein
VSGVSCLAQIIHRLNEGRDGLGFAICQTFCGQLLLAVV